MRRSRTWREQRFGLLVQNFLGSTDHLFPVQSRTGIVFIFLDVIVPDHALILFQLIIRQFMRIYSSTRFSTTG